MRDANPNPSCRRERHVPERHVRENRVPERRVPERRIRERHVIVRCNGLSTEVFLLPSRRRLPLTLSPADYPPLPLCFQLVSAREPHLHAIEVQGFLLRTEGGNLVFCAYSLWACGADGIGRYLPMREAALLFAETGIPHGLFPDLLP